MAVRADNKMETAADGLRLREAAKQRRDRAKNLANTGDAHGARWAHREADDADRRAEEILSLPEKPAIGTGGELFLSPEDAAEKPGLALTVEEAADGGVLEEIGPEVLDRAGIQFQFRPLVLGGVRNIALPVGFLRPDAFGETPRIAPRLTVLGLEQRQFHSGQGTANLILRLFSAQHHRHRCKPINADPYQRSNHDTKHSAQYHTLTYLFCYH